MTTNPFRRALLALWVSLASAGALLGIYALAQQNLGSQPTWAGSTDYGAPEGALLAAGILIAVSFLVLLHWLTASAVLAGLERRTAADADAPAEAVPEG